MPISRSKYSALLDTHMPGRFNVSSLQRVGRGSEGTVVSVLDSHTWKRRAVKFFDQGSAYERAEREMTLLRRLAAARTPNILPILDQKIHDESETAFLVTEYFDEGDLFSLKADLFPTSPLPVDLMVNFARSLANTIHYLHTRTGTIHGDLKPENILLRRAGDGEFDLEFVLTDFGMSWNVHTDPDKDGEYDKAWVPGRVLPTPEPRMSGTKGYLAPEACKGERSPAQDWYALGKIVKFLLIGQESCAKPTRARDSVGLVALADFAKQCLIRDPILRLGDETVRSHPLFSGMTWSTDAYPSTGRMRGVSRLKVDIPLSRPSSSESDEESLYGGDSRSHWSSHSSASRSTRSPVTPSSPSLDILMARKLFIGTDAVVSTHM